MNKNTKTIILVTGGVLVLGVGVALATRRKDGGTTTTTTTTTTDSSLTESQQKGMFWGNLASSLWAGLRQNQNNNTSTGDGTCGGVVVPVDPYVADSIVASNYTSSQIVKMQTYLASLHSDIATVIADSGGADGIIGPGFKEAYNMARKGCYITGISDLINKSGA